MQLTIDTQYESSRALRLYSEFMLQLASLVAAELTDNRQTQLDFERDHALPVAPPPTAPIDPRDNPFRGHTDAQPWLAPAPSNVVPFVPAPPPATAPPPAPNIVPFAPPAPIAPAPATAPTNAPSAAQGAGVVPPAPSVASAPVGCDSTGLPWDERIHSSGENKLNSDGTWRQKRGANPMLVASVTAELRARPPQAAVSPPPPPAAAGTATQVLPLPVPPPPAAVSVQPSDTGLPAPVLPVLPPPAVGTVPAAVTFTQLFAAANRHGFDNDRLSALVVKAGGTGLESLVNNPALIAIVHQMVQESAGAQ